MIVIGDKGVFFWYDMIDVYMTIHFSGANVTPHIFGLKFKPSFLCVLTQN